MRGRVRMAQITEPEPWYLNNFYRKLCDRNATNTSVVEQREEIVLTGNNPIMYSDPQVSGQRTSVKNAFLPLLAGSGKYIKELLRRYSQNSRDNVVIEEIKRLQVVLYKLEQARTICTRNSSKIQIEGSETIEKAQERVVKDIEKHLEDLYFREYDSGALFHTPESRLIHYKLSFGKEMLRRNSGSLPMLLSNLGGALTQAINKIKAEVFSTLQLSSTLHQQSAFNDMVNQPQADRGDRSASIPQITLGIDGSQADRAADGDPASFEVGLDYDPMGLESDPEDPGSLLAQHSAPPPPPPLPPPPPSSQPKPNGPKVTAHFSGEPQGQAREPQPQPKPELRPLTTTVEEPAPNQAGAKPPKNGSTIYSKTFFVLRENRKGEQINEITGQAVIDSFLNSEAGKQFITNFQKQYSLPSSGAASPTAKTAANPATGAALSSPVVARVAFRAGGAPDDLKSTSGSPTTTVREVKFASDPQFAAPLDNGAAAGAGNSAGAGAEDSVVAPRHEELSASIALANAFVKYGVQLYRHKDETNHGDQLDGSDFMADMQEIIDNPDAIYNYFKTITIPDKRLAAELNEKFRKECGIADDKFKLFAVEGEPMILLEEAVKSCEPQGVQDKLRYSLQVALVSMAAAEARVQTVEMEEVIKQLKEKQITKDEQVADYATVDSDGRINKSLKVEGLLESLDEDKSKTLTEEAKKITTLSDERVAIIRKNTVHKAKEAGQNVGEQRSSATPDAGGPATPDAGESKTPQGGEEEEERKEAPNPSREGKAQVSRAVFGPYSQRESDASRGGRGAAGPSISGGHN